MIRRIASILVIAAVAGAGIWFRPAAEAFDIGEELATIPPQHRGCLGFFERGITSSIQVGSTLKGPVVAALAAGSGSTPPVEVQIDDAGGAAVALEDLGAAGVTGALVELPSAESAAGITEVGPVGTMAAACTPPITDRMIISGGSTGTGETLDLLITNPYAQDAVVAITGSSEVGIDNAASLEEVVVPAGSTISRSLDAELNLRQSLSTYIEVVQGAVHAAYLQRIDGDAALIEGVEPGADWWLPVVPIEGATQRLVIATDSPSNVNVQVDRYTSDGVEERLVELAVEAQSQIEVAVADLGEGASGLRVSADGPVAVTLVAAGPGMRAATPATKAIATDWLVPGVGGAGGNIWITNPGDVISEVILQPLAPDTPARAVTVAPGATSSTRIDRLGSGYLIRSASPVTMLWFSAPDVGRSLATPSAIDLGER